MEITGVEWLLAGLAGVIGVTVGAALFKPRRKARLQNRLELQPGYAPPGAPTTVMSKAELLAMVANLEEDGFALAGKPTRVASVSPLATIDFHGASPVVTLSPSLRTEE